MTFNETLINRIAFKYNTMRSAINHTILGDSDFINFRVNAIIVFYVNSMAIRVIYLGELSVTLFQNGDESYTLRMMVDLAYLRCHSMRPI